MKNYLIGIDIGTSSTKAAITDYTGKIISLGQVAYDIHTPKPDWAEQEPEMWWKAAVNAVKIAAGQIKGDISDKVAGIGLSGQMHGLVVMNEHGKALRSSIIWADQRTKEEVLEYYRVIGREALAGMTANPVAAGFFGPSLLWIKKHEPEVYKQIRWALLPKDYVRYRLTGQIGTEATDACSTLLFDTAKRSWSFELCSLLGLGNDYLPPCAEPWELAGVLNEEAAREMGLKPGIPVAFGGGDQPMQALGNGICLPGTVSVTIGTGGQIFTPVQKPVYDSKLRTHTFCHAVPGTWNVMGATLSAGLSLKWLCGQIIGSADYKESDRAAAEIPAGSEGLIFLPYLLGERTPHMDPMARGAFIGLSLRHTRAHMIRAVMEGVTFALHEVLEIFKGLGLPIEHLTASGGGSYSPLWRQIMADVFNCTVEITDAKEQACLGAALTAGTAAGVYSSILEACSKTAVPPHAMETSNPGNVEVYQSMLSIYREAYSTNRNLFHALSKINGKSI